jgi:hypothetical protein
MHNNSWRGIIGTPKLPVQRYFHPPRAEPGCYYMRGVRKVGDSKVGDRINSVPRHWSPGNGPFHYC